MKSTIRIAFEVNIDTPSEVQNHARELVVQGLQMLLEHKVDFMPESRELVDRMLNDWEKMD